MPRLAVCIAQFAARPQLQSKALAAAVHTHLRAALRTAGKNPAADHHRWAPLLVGTEPIVMAAAALHAPVSTDSDVARCLMHGTQLTRGVDDAAVHQLGLVLAADVVGRRRVLRLLPTLARCLRPEDRLSLAFVHGLVAVCTLQCLQRRGALRRMLQPECGDSLAKATFAVAAAAAASTAPLSASAESDLAILRAVFWRLPVFLDPHGVLQALHTAAADRTPAAHRVCVAHDAWARDVARGIRSPASSSFSAEASRHLQQLFATLFRYHMHRMSETGAGSMLGIVPFARPEPWRLVSEVHTMRGAVEDGVPGATDHWCSWIELFITVLATYIDALEKRSEFDGAAKSGMRAAAARAAAVHAEVQRKIRAGTEPSKSMLHLLRKSTQHIHEAWRAVELVIAKTFRHIPRTSEAEALAAAPSSDTRGAQQQLRLARHHGLLGTQG